MTGLDALIAQYARAFATAVEPSVRSYFDAGAGSGVSTSEARDAWLRYRLLPSVLRDVSSVDTSVEVLGSRLASPVGVAPMGYLGLLHPDGEQELARGLSDHLLVLSTRASRRIEDVAAAHDGPWWFQVYVTADRRVSDALVQRAAAAGATALVLTGDTPYVGRKPGTGRPAAVDDAAEQSPAVTTDDIGRLASISGLPVLVKGVLRADDTRRCLDAGAAGLVVSNHGGRQLDRAIATARALPAVVAAAGDAPVLVDGGLRSGLDVLTALALGARAALVGRPFAWALAADGADAVTRLLSAFDDEFAHVLGLAGCRCVGDVTTGHVTG